MLLTPQQEADERTPSTASATCQVEAAVLASPCGVLASAEVHSGVMFDVIDVADFDTSGSSLGCFADELF
eukprot:3398367-Pyramimonas_sp.AAC.1